MKAHAVTFIVATVVIATLGWMIGHAALNAAKNTNGTDQSPDGNWLKTMGN